MNSLFENQLIISGITGVFILLFMAVERLLCRKTGALWRVALWLLVSLRLLIPLQINTPYHLITIGQPVGSYIQVRAPGADQVNANESGSGTASGLKAGAASPAADIKSKEAESATAYQASPLPARINVKSMRINIYDVIWYIYLAGVAAALLLLAARQIALGRRVSRLKALHDPRLEHILRATKERLNIKKAIAVLEDPSIHSPSITGFFRPKLLFPAGLAESLSNGQLEFVCLHELMHYKGMDLLKLWLAELAVCLHWFNPVLHLCRGQMRQDIELACDEKILKKIGRAEYREYGKVLLDISTGSPNARIAPAFANMAARSKKRLKERLQMIQLHTGRNLFHSSVALLLCAVLLLAACTSLFNKKVVYADDIADKNPLQVYLVDFDLYEKGAIDSYNRLINSGKISGRKINVTTFPQDQYDQMYQRIASEIQLGEGPDIIFIDPLFNQVNDFTKMSEQNAFADMDILIQNSKTFDFSAYNKAALDAGIVFGKRVLMPLSYRVNYLVTTQENLDRIHASPSGKLNYAQMFDWMEICHKETNSLMIDNDSPSRLFNSGLLTKNGLDTSAMPDMERYINLLKEEKKRQNDMGDMSGSTEDFLSVLCNGQVLFTNTASAGDSGGDFDLLYTFYNIIQNKYGKHFVMLNLPNPDNKSYAELDEGCAININSKHKNDAFTFVEYLLSEDGESGSNPVFGFPVNKAAFQKEEQKLQGGVYTGTSDYRTCPVPEEIQQAFLSMIENVDGYHFTDSEEYVTLNILEPILEDYEDGKIDYPTMIDKINSALKLYYSE